MSLVIDHPTRGSIKIKTFDSATLEQEKKRASLAKIVAVVRSFIEQVGQEEQSRPLTDREIDFLEAAEGWCGVAESFASQGCDRNELLQVAKIGKEVEGFSSLTVVPGEALWIEQLAVTPANLSLPSGIGSTLFVTACMEGRRRHHHELSLCSLYSAVGFYRKLSMREVNHDLTGCSTFSLNLLEPLPPRLEKIASQIHAVKRHLKSASSEVEEPPLKKHCTKPIPEEAPKK